MLGDFFLRITWSLSARFRALAGFFLLLSGCVLPLGAQVKPVRRVLILDDLGIISSPGFAEINRAVLARLQNSPYQIELYQESLDLTLFPDKVRWFGQEFVRKYSDRKPDVIIAAGSASLEFLVERSETFIRDVPIIFCAIVGQIPERKSDVSLTGVLGKPRPEETLNAALHLLPSTKHVVVTGGVGKFDVPWEALAKQSFQNYESKLEFTYLTDLAMPTLLERLRHLPSNTIVFHTAISQDAEGSRFIDSTQSVPLVVSAANAPVFVMDDVDFRGGAVGGDLVNWANDGRVAAEMALRVLNGERPQDIPVLTSRDVYMFDWRALKRWGMNDKNLPVGSIVTNRQPSFWDVYKEYVSVAIVALLVQAVAILGLLWQRAERRKTEVELRRSEEKFSKSFRHSPLAISLTTTNDDLYIEVNETFEQLTGWAHGEVTGRGPRDVKLWVDPNQRIAFVKQLLEEGHVENLEVRLCRKDGQIRTTLGSAELIDVGGESCALSVFADITERKHAEETLASVSRRLIEAQELERTRIARELHDDINQRIAMLSVDLDRLQQSISGSDRQTSIRIKALQGRLSDIGLEVQTISHRLHSSKLEYLGLAVACKSFCREVAERHKVTVEFAAEDIPPGVSKDVSLCLFRVLQEALSNAIKYSGVQHFEVRLCRVSDDVQLVVRDHGRGFDVDAALRGEGLGLISMRERASLVKGIVSITSTPTGGTEVNVRVPCVLAKDVSELTFGAA
jgi:PAS domain S-box-containing protein